MGYENKSSELPKASSQKHTILIATDFEVKKEN